MRAELYIPDWVSVSTVDLASINRVLEGAWSDAAAAYAAEWTAQRTVRRRGPVGAQRYLNAVLDDRFQHSGWTAYASTFTRGDLWFRVTFRHQMSAGANFLDALKAVKKYEFRAAVIGAATRAFLEDISPADAPALTSFEKLRAEVEDLRGVWSAPVLLAALHPCSALPPKTSEVIGDPRRRR